jgi:hypothetical protein
MDMVSEAQVETKAQMKGTRSFVTLCTACLQGLPWWVRQAGSLILNAGMHFAATYQAQVVRHAVIVQYNARLPIKETLDLLTARHICMHSTTF